MVLLNESFRADCSHIGHFCCKRARVWITNVRLLGVDRKEKRVLSESICGGWFMGRYK